LRYPASSSFEIEYHLARQFSEFRGGAIQNRWHRRIQLRVGMLCASCLDG
jgi:hypothetical protein